MNTALEEPENLLMAEASFVPAQVEWDLYDSPLRGETIIHGWIATNFLPLSVGRLVSGSLFK